MTQDSNNEEQSTQDLLLAILEQLEQLNLRVNNLADQRPISTELIASPSNSLSSTPTSFNQRRTTNYNDFEIGDTVVITHHYRGQFGITGVIYKQTTHYVWLRTSFGATYKKKKNNVRKED
jgi:hypothetical protein